MISVSSVLRNEEHHLPAFIKRLDALPGQVNEWVVVDQASTDHSRQIIADARSELATAGVDVVYVQKAACGYCELHRNESIEIAKNDFVLVLDIDEWVDGSPSLLLLRDQCRAQGADAAMMPRRNYIQDVPQMGGRMMQYFGDDAQVRFLRRGGVSWGRQPHCRPVTPRGTIVAWEFPIHHLWYWKTQIEKRNRVLAAMRANGIPEERVQFTESFLNETLNGFASYLGLARSSA